MASRILNFGSLNLDHVYQVPHFVRPGETLHTTRYAVHAGGKGLNQSIAAARAGAEVWHAGRIGPDGGSLRDLLARENVHVDLLVAGGSSTGHTVIQIDPHGENSILLHGGANREIPAEQIPRALEPFGNGDFLLLQNETNVTAELLAAGARRGLTILFNPAPMDETAAGLPLTGVAVLAVNQQECRALGDDESVEIAAEKIRKRHPGLALLLTLGSDGSVYFSGRDEIRLEAERVATVDTTGAGDAFIGYFAAGLARGAAPLDALEEANRAAALCVSRTGAAASIPYRQEVLAFQADRR